MRRFWSCWRFGEGNIVRQKGKKGKGFPFLGLWRAGNFSFVWGKKGVGGGWGGEVEFFSIHRWRFLLGSGMKGRGGGGREGRAYIQL